MPLLIRCRAWKASFQGKEKKKKKSLLNWKEKEKRREKGTEKMTQQVVLALKKCIIKGECVSIALKVLN
jgi:hypothetical protein